MKRKLMSFLAVLFALVGVLALGACNGDQQTVTPPQSGDEVGEYYYDADGTEWLLTLQEECKFTLSISSETRSGDYTLDGETLTLAFSDEKGGETSATLREGVVRLSYNGNTYNFLIKKNFTVHFDTADGTAIPDATVLNGKCAEKPDTPEKEGYVFIDWYTDAAFTVEFNFSQPITGDITLYARFVSGQKDDVEFSVNFDLGFDDMEPIPARETLRGVIYSLPEPEREGEVFVGWWVSHYGTREKLTYRYNEQKLLEDTTLYAVWASDAPAVSVEADKITWTSAGVGSNYNLKIVAPSGEEETRTLGETSFAYDFAGKEEGEYTVTVTVGNYSTTAYYKNKGLAKASGFRVEGDVLMWNPVENATHYTITVDCGTEGHTHIRQDNGDRTSFDFSACDMKVGGIGFTVFAEATGYVYSQSETYYVERTLGGIAGFTVDPVTEIATWDEVDHATSYEFVLKKGSEEVYRTTVGANRTVALKGFGAASYTVSVVAAARGWNSPAASEFPYDKETLAAPANVRLDGSKVEWDPVDGAQSYFIKIGDDEYPADAAGFLLTEEYYDATQSSYLISVRAEDANGKKSVWSDVLTVKNGEMGDTLTYSAGVLSWDAVFGVNTFHVVYNGGEQQEVVGKNSLEIKLEAKVNEFSVCAVLADGTETAPVTLTVEAYCLSFDAGDGSDVPPLYFAKDDPIGELPRSERPGYDFADWYTAPENGLPYSDKFYTDEADRTLYAKWNPKQYTVSFVVGTLGKEPVASVQVYYQQRFQLPVAVSNDPIKAFVGWYTDANGAGIRYTDYSGASLIEYPQVGDITLYANYLDIFAFTKIQGGYSVSKSRDIGLTGVKEITIPQTYQDEPVTTVDDFSDCRLLEVIHIPNTVSLISIAATGAAFSGCTALREIDIQTVEGNHPVYYRSVNGMLIYDNPTTTYTELKFYPVGKADTIVRVPDGVQVLPTRVFDGCTRVEEFIIPASVILVESRAFYFNSSYGKLERITFLKAEEGTEEVPLSIHAEAFYKCGHVTDFTLPARMTGFSTDMFVDCDAVVNFNIVGEGGEYSSEEGLLCRTTPTGKELCIWPAGRTGEFTVPASVVSIGEGALKGNENITKITIPGTVTNIGKQAFMGESLKKMPVTEIVFLGKENDPDLTIGEEAFANCGTTALVSIVLPENLVSLAKNAFRNTSIKEVTVNSGAGGRELSFADQAFGSTSSVSVLNLGKYVNNISFTGVFGASLKEVNVDPDNENYQSEKGVVYNKDMTLIAYFPDAYEGVYTLPETITELPAEIFRSKKSLTSIVIHNKVTSIGDNAFKASGLESITFLDGGNEPLTIGNYVFQSTPLTEISFPERTESLGKQLFGDAKLKSVHLPASLKYITPFDEGYMMMFYGTSSYLTEFTVAEGNNYYAAIDNVLYMKSYDEATEEYYISDLIYCPYALTGTIHVPGTVERVWEQAFHYPLNVSGVPSYSSVVFEDLVPKTDPETGMQVQRTMTMGEWCFSYCPDLTNVTLPNGLVSIGQYAFNECRKLTSINIPNTVNSIAGKAFTGCTALSEVTFAAGNDDNPLRLEDGTSSGGAFYGTFALHNIELPARTSYIGNYTFYNGGIVSIAIPANVTVIGEYAFGMGDKGVALESVSIPTNSKLTSIGKYAFRSAHITAVNLPSTLETIGDYAFYDCNELISVTFARNSKLNSIGSYAFSGCEALTDVDFNSNSSLTTINANAFRGDVGLRGIVIPASVETIGASAFEGDTRLETILFEERNNKLKQVNAAFKGTAITEIVFPESSNTITLAQKLFLGCNKLETVHLSSTIASINNVFQGCGSITKITVAENSENFTVDPDRPIIYNKKDGSVLYVYGAISGDFSLGQGATEIGGSAFYAQTDVETIFIPRTVEKIGSEAFRNCVNLREVTIEAGSALTEIGANAFNGCTSLTSINLENAVNLKTVGMYFLANCTSLPSVDLSKTKIVTIPGYAFDGCSSLATVKLPSTVTTFTGSYTFRNSGITELDLSGLTNLKTITATSMCYGCADLTSIKFPTGITYLGTGTFTNCVGLVEVDLSTLTSLEQFHNAASGTTTVTSAANTFMGCSSLKKVILPSTLKRIGRDTFKDCASLEDINLDGVELVGNGAFSGCGFKQLRIPGNVKTWGSGSVSSYAVFGNCMKLEKIIFASDLGANSLTAYMFMGCGGQFTVEFEEGCGLTTLPQYLFDGATGLTYFKLPAQITTLGTYTFRNCKNLVTADFSEYTGTSLPNYTFAGCTQLSNVYLPAGLKTFGTNVFQDCASLTSIELPINVTELSSNLFNGCGSLSQINLGNITKYGSSCLKGTAISSIDFSADVTSLGANMLENCVNLSSATFAEGFKVNLPNNMFKGCVLLDKIVLPGAATSYGTNVFQDCTNLSSVDFSGYTGTALSNYMFAGCTSLTSIEFPASVNYLGTHTFEGSGLQRADLSGTKLTKFAGSATGSVTVTSGSSNSFTNCADLTEVTLPEGFTAIGGYTFQNCTSLTTVNGVENVEIISTYAFDGCTSLQGLATSSLTGVGSYAFRNCEQLASIDTSKVTVMKNYAFYGCSALTSLDTTSLSDVKSTSYLFSFSGLESFNVPLGVVEGLAGTDFIGCGALKTFTVASGNEAYEVDSTGALLSKADGTLVSFPAGKEVGDDGKLTLDEDVVSIGNYAFAEAGNVKEVVLPQNFTKIGDYAFQNSAIENVVYPEVSDPENIVYIAIGQHAFENSALTSLDLPESVNSIGASAFVGCPLVTVDIKNADAFTQATLFDGCTTLREVTIPEGVVKLNNNVFRGTEALTAIRLPESLTAIGSSVFEGSGIEHIVIPETVTSIGSSAFKNSALRTVEIGHGDAIKSATSLFEGCVNLTQVTIGSGLTAVAGSQFKGCTSLTSIVLPDTVASIGADAFTDTSLEEFTIPASLTKLDKNFGVMFSYLDSIVIPMTVSSIDAAAFADWTEEQTIRFEASEFVVTAIIGTDWRANVVARIEYGYEKA